jgi:MYXO-CTERM domain-containing protein
MKNAVIALVSVAGLASVASAQWTGASIQSGDVRFQVQAGTASSTTTTLLFTNLTGSASSFTADFRVSGASGTDHNFSNWWAFRSGNDTREFPIALPSTAQQNAAVKSFDASSVQWDNLQPASAGTSSGLRFKLNYEVIDLDGAGTLAGRVISRLTVTNVTAATISNVNLFHYVDYYFTGEDSGDQVVAGDAGVSGGNRFISIRDAGDSVWGTAGANSRLLHEGVGATGYGVGAFSTVGGQITDTGIDNFADFNNATTAGDQSGVMQWNFGDLAPGATATAIGVLTIPTPGAFALLGLGGLAVARRRR